MVPVLIGCGWVLGIRRCVQIGASGLIRVLEIDGIDKNLCCGTHIKSTTHLQAVKLLKVGLLFF